MPRGLIVCMPFENHVPGRVSLEEGNVGTIGVVIFADVFSPGIGTISDGNEYVE